VDKEIQQKVTRHMIDEILERKASPYSLGNKIFDLVAIPVNE
jgi:hypothetical protein